MKDYLPNADAALANWTAHFAGIIAATPTDYGLTPVDAANYLTLQSDFVNKLAAATGADTRGKRTVFQKDQTKKLLVKQTRSIAQQINKMISVTDDQRQALGLTIASPDRKPVPVPSARPKVNFNGINGRTVSVELRQDSNKRGRPTKVTGATIFTAPLGTSLTDTDSWSFLTSTTQTKVDVTFPAGEAQTVQITAFWTNARNESGPAGFPITVNLPASQQLPGEVKMKMAA